MSEKKKTLSSLSSLIQEFPFEYGDVQLNLQIDVDALTDDYYRKIGKIQASKLKTEPEVKSIENLSESVEKSPEELAQAALEESKSVIEGIYNHSADIVSNKRDTWITLLLCGDEAKEGSLLRGWDATDDAGNVSPLNREILLPLSPKFIENLWEFCVEQASGSKKS